MVRNSPAHEEKPASWVGRAALYLARTVDGAVLLGLGLVARALGSCLRRPGEGVCVVTNTMAVGGTQRQILVWLRWQRSGVPVRVVLLSGGGEWQQEVERLGVPVVVVADQFAGSRWGRLFFLSFPRTAYSLALYRLFRQYGPQLVWSWLFLARVVAAPAARLAGVPRLLGGVRGLSIWESWPENRHWWYRQADRHAAALSDLVLVNAEALQEDHVNWTGCRREKVRVVVNGLPFAEGADGGGGPAWGDPPESLPVVLTVGRLAVEKAQGVLLEASARVWRAGFPHRLALVGGGPQEAALRELAGQLGIAEHVLFLGERHDVADLYRRGTIFALSSRIEGMPNALLEAQAFGLPAVTTDAGGVREVVVHGETGFIVPVGDVAAFAEALHRLLADPELRQRMGEAASRRVKEVFSVERMLEEVEKVFAELGVGAANHGAR